MFGGIGGDRAGNDVLVIFDQADNSRISDQNGAEDDQ